MPVEMNTPLGKIDVSEEVIARIAGGAAMEVFGLVGMASRKALKDGIAELLKKDNLSKGVVVRNEDNDVSLDLHIIVSYGTKISEVAGNVQSRVRYTLEQTLGVEVSAINIYVQGVRTDREL
ncbi:Asp23/Gls24 family envelope stress response protein [Brevibacillus laterosporus]|uniref:Asp23/Gls24 family envelope stress response protein n=1 Tax=Brevibacillus halotolerans TaxID=1507437 RepID=A0ABT4HRT2_9BACL|nr:MULTISPECIES: Asp23/Gls24 family envelope stress response protein [Brevibacillus]MCR8983790.1 Asp23/Gls24 family envelope stress response protein [Brevibacillus laterosporus]MCZ0829509.1 Asp23/Gls24 family envelope stress response protein [Brevibacillus halotolerans]